MPSSNYDFYVSREWRGFRTRVLKELDRICSICNQEVFGSDITLDHILPMSKHPDLALEPTNVRVLCRVCNSRKRDLLDVRNNYFNSRYLSSSQQQR